MKKDEYTIVDEINDEVRWAKDYFTLSDIETERFRNCFEEFYSGKPVGEIRPRKAYYLKGNLLQGCSGSNIVLLTAIARIYSIRFRDYIELYLPDSLHDTIYPADADKIEVAPDFIDIVTEMPKNPNDKLMGEHISEWCKYNKKVLLYMNNSSEVEIRQKDEIITKIKIVSSYGTLSLNESMLEMTTDAKNNNTGILSQIREGCVVFSTSDELEQLRREMKELMYFPDDDENFSFGRQRNSKKKEFIESFMPLYRCLSERIKIQSAPMFDSYCKRDYYQFILDMLEIPIDFICIDDMEFYLKSPKKLDLKKVNLDLPF